MATPFQVASPCTATSYPRADRSSPSSDTKASSASLVSCRQTTSGFRSSSHGSSRGTRCLTELTFQVAIRTEPPRYRRRLGSSRTMPQLEFNEETAAELEAVYSKPDILRRRALVHDALGAQPGERILDAGCGPGFYVAETLERVGPEGSVAGVDASAPMLAVAAKRCEGHGNVSFHEGDVTALPVG